MSIKSVNTIAYGTNDEIDLVVVFVNGKPIGICEEHAVEEMLFAMGYRR